MRRLRDDDDGQVLLLVLGYAVVAIALLTVVVDVSRLFQARRSLAAAADGAAVAAANAPDVSAIYAGTASPASLPLRGPAVRAAVEQYAVDARLDERFAAAEVGGVATDGTTATVTLRATVDLTFLTAITAGLGGSVDIDATASARSPYQP